MKKWFTCITSILYVLFFCFILKASPDSMLFSMYPDVLVRSIPQEVDLAQLQAALDDLGKETDSLIALRVAQPSNDQGKTSRFTYILFGSGRLPDGFAEADEQDRKLVNLAATYSILDGALSQQRLAAALQSVGAEVVFFPGESSPLTLSLGYLPRPSLSFSLILFGLLFIVLISMRRIKELRASGIQVLSGMDRSRLFKRFLLDDFLSILLGFLAAALTSAGFLCLMKLWNPRFFIFLLTAAGLYALILLALALLMEFLFRRILRKSKLIELIKGKMPLRSVLAVLMAGQFIAFLGVGFGSHMVSVVFPLYQTMTQGMQAWAERPDAFHFMYNLGSFDAKQRERQNQRSFAWYDFAREALQDPDVLYCEHFLREMDPILPTVEESRKLLLVSPSFLKKEGLLSDPQEQARMENLKEGEFGLILPAGLSDTQRADT
ncbi:MAG: hypothetical protein SOR89_02195, partial [Ndongobacter sp.]|nr:hypothetical protein [Ndongobacter sp.]